MTDLDKSCVFAGRSTADLIYLFPYFPEENSKIFAEESVICGGGPALNASVTFSALGGQSYLATQVGKDELSHVVIRDLALNRVELLNCTNDVFEYSMPCSSIMVSRNKNTRTIINQPTLKDAIATISDFDLEKIVHVDLVSIDGYMTEVSLKIVAYLKKEGKTIVMDGGSLKDNTLKLLEQTDILIMSQHFYEQARETFGVSSVSEISKFGPLKVAKTDGANHIEWHDETSGGIIEINSNGALDTTGAGDVFQGAFCYYYLHGNKFRESLVKASQIASRSCKFLGTRKWINGQQI